MSSQYSEPRPNIPAKIRRQALIEAGHCCSVSHCHEHTYLELHHINENREDNTIENVIALCDKHHKMAHAGVIDRKALREYKRLNRESLGLSKAYDLPAIIKAKYLRRLSEWLTQEQQRLEASHLSSNTSNAHIAPSLRFYGHELATLIDNDAVMQAMQDFLVEHPRYMLLGNGGSGKTVALLSWLRYQCFIAQENDTAPIPIFVSLHGLTPATTLLTLLRSAIGKHGINLSNKQIEALLGFGHMCVVFDGLNEINHSAVNNGALEDILNFLDSYPDSYFIISSRYIPVIRDWRLPKLEMGAWDTQRIRSYLIARLGSDLGDVTYQCIGDRLDFEWLSGCSVAGLCSNPLTLWMLATVTEKKQEPPDESEEIVDSLVSLAVQQVIERYRVSIAPRILIEALEDVAYLMIARGDILSTSYEVAVELSAQILHEKQWTGLVPSDWDAYQLLSQLLRTGLLRQLHYETVEWLHQVVQERLSVRSSDRRFSEAINLAQKVNCPKCNYRADKYFEQDGILWGECKNTERCSLFEIRLPEVVYTDFLKEKVAFIDHIGAPREYGMVFIPNSFIDERWMAFMPIAGATYCLALSFAQDDEINEIARARFIAHTGQPSLSVNLEVLVLEKAGIFHLEHKGNRTNIHIYTPPANPSLRLPGYTLVVLRDLSYEELGEESDERFVITSSEKEKYFKERKGKNLPIYYKYPFGEKDKQKVFRLAEKFGGQVLRTWGPYEEVVAELPGEAWDFSSYVSDH